MDEFQDTNPAQLDLLELLGAGTRNVTVVGDDDQAIYAFRGAAVENLLGFEARFPGTRDIALRRNHRSRRPIVEAARRLIRHNDPHRLEARGGIDRTPVVTRRARGRGRSSPATFATVRRGGGLGGRGDPPAHRPAAPVPGTSRSSCAPTRTRSRILRSLNMAGVPWTFSGATGFHARPVVRELMAFLRLVADPIVEHRLLRGRHRSARTDSAAPG